MNKFKTHVQKYGLIIIGSVLAVMLMVYGGSAAVRAVYGLAVAASTTTWNSIKDATQGDNLTDGLPAVALYGHDGTNFDRITITSGALDITTGVGATDPGKAEDAVHASGDTGNMTLAVRNDVLASLVDTDGDYAPFQVDASGSLYVTSSAAAVVGGGTEATAQRVTIANDSTGLLSIDDNGGSLTVDGTLAVTNAGTFVVQEDGAALTSLQLIDNVIVVLGTGTYSEATSSGNVLGAVRNDTLATLADTDNEFAPFQVNADGALYVNHSSFDVVGGGAEATSLRVTLANDSTGLLSVDDNAGSLTVDNSILSVVGGGTEAAAQRVTLANDSTGVLSVDDNGGALTVDWAGTAPPIGGGTEATALKVTMSSDSTGLLSVDDNGALLSIDGVITTADDFSNPTTSIDSNSLNSEFDGTTWDRTRHSFTQATTGITTNAAGTTVAMATTPMSKFSMLIDRTVGATDVVEVDLECSLDGTIFVQIATITDLTNEPVLTSTDGTPCTDFRYNVVTVGSGNTLTVQLLGVR